jgi:hypothetical protein
MMPAITSTAAAAETFFVELGIIYKPPLSFALG